MAALIGSLAIRTLGGVWNNKMQRWLRHDRSIAAFVRRRPPARTTIVSVPKHVELALVVDRGIIANVTTQLLLSTLS